MKRIRLFNLIALAIAVAVNALANILPINGLNTGEISDSIPVLFTPAGYVFSIWGLIYLSLFAFGIYQILGQQRDNPRLERIGYWFIASCAFNALWLVFWHYKLFAVTLVLMLGLLISLLVIYLRVRIGRPRKDDPKVTLAGRLLVDLPFGLYLGWVSVATVANVTTVLYQLDWSGWGLSAEVWTMLMMAVASLLGILMAWTRRAIAYPLVISWALVGIGVANAGNTGPVVAAYTLAALVFVAMALLLWQRNYEPSAKPVVTPGSDA